MTAPRHHWESCVGGATRCLDGSTAPWLAPSCWSTRVLPCCDVPAGSREGKLGDSTGTAQEPDRTIFETGGIVGRRWRAPDQSGCGGGPGGPADDELGLEEQLVLGDRRAGDQPDQ